MKLSYYPGCALHGTALEYDESTRAVAGLLDLELCELPDWNCCGASSAHAVDGELARRLMARNLKIVGEQGMDLVIPCAACYGRFKAAEKEAPSPPGQRVLNLVELLASPECREKIQARPRRSLSGLKVVCYYGCLLVRPPALTGAESYENPEEMDRLMELLGAEVIPWSFKTDCCGGSLVLTRTDIVLRLTGRLLDQALRAGAEAVVVACPMCQANLDTRQEEISRQAGKEYRLPVLYFTELLGLALGHPRARRWVKRHFVDPRGLLQAKGLIAC
ncbi:MAG: CoB--CoM heterodisulfide reductase iron-sulfur subunit B family protein [Deltaproteobacteria bacterium]|nr:CoB--CoM heterodisulfide reductase iron-sulfur subunit B family protein [Deltaproteobacteria bacterium]